jgi:IclR family pca regulon transcriptional regulator
MALVPGGRLQLAEVAPPRSRSEYVQSLDRGLAVIRAFDADHQRLTLSEVAERTGLTRAAARRFLHTLRGLGYVALEGRHFFLRPRLLELGYAYLSALTIPQLAAPHIERLARVAGESVSISVLDGSDVVYVARIASRRIMSVDLSIGTRLPAYVTSMGRVLLAALPPGEIDAHLGELVRMTDRTLTDRAGLLAELEKVRDQGWAVVDEELEEGLRSMAAPIHDAHDRVVAALNVSTVARRTSVEAFVIEQLSRLLNTAAAVSAAIREQARVTSRPAESGL